MCQLFSLNTSSIFVNIKYVYSCYGLYIKCQRQIFLFYNIGITPKIKSNHCDRSAIAKYAHTLWHNSSILGIFPTERYIFTTRYI